MRTTLIAVAHPDDIEVNMAHLVRSRIEQGNSVTALIATNGEASTINLRRGRFCR